MASVPAGHPVRPVPAVAGARPASCRSRPTTRSTSPAPSSRRAARGRPPRRAGSPTWFFGFPLGELYPVLGDLGVIALRVLSLGLLDWPQAYAGLFTLVFLTQGWALLRCGRALGWGPDPGPGRRAAGARRRRRLSRGRVDLHRHLRRVAAGPRHRPRLPRLRRARPRPGPHGRRPVPSDTSPAPSESPFAASAPVLRTHHLPLRPARAPPRPRRPRRRRRPARAPDGADDARPRRPALPPDRRPAPRAPPRAPRPPRRHHPPPPPRARPRRRPRGLVAAADERPPRLDGQLRVVARLPEPRCCAWPPGPVDAIDARRRRPQREPRPAPRRAVRPRPAALLRAVDRRALAARQHRPVLGPAPRLAQRRLPAHPVPAVPDRRQAGPVPARRRRGRRPGAPVPSHLAHATCP
jgi:hypothetical protein